MRLAILAPELTRGVRAAIATIVPFYLALAYAEPALAWVALGGWLGALADPGGSRRLRAVGMAWFTSLGGLAVALGALVAPVPWLASVVIAAIAFVAALARALGGNATSIANIIAIGAAIAASRPVGGPLSDAALTGALFAIGALWAVATSSIAWPIWPHLPDRRALALAYRELANYARAMQTARSEAAWSEVARTHQRKVRAAIEAARGVMVASRARRSGETPVGANLRVLLGEADQQLFALVAMAEHVEAGGDAPLAQLARIYDAIDLCLLTRKPGPAMTDGPASALDPTAPSFGGAARRVEAAARVAHATARDLDAPPTVLPASTPHRPTPWAIGDALSPRSPYFRHGIRVAATVAIAIDVARLVSPDHASWITVTAMAVLQPYLGPTLQRVLERIVGTMVGALMAVGLMRLFQAPLALAGAMVPLSIAAVVTRPRSYRLFVVFLTPVFLLVADHWHPTSNVALVRIADVAIGGAIAFVTALIIPSTERRRMPDALAQVQAALVAYVERVGTGGDLAAARRDVGIALENAEVSLERMLAEPKLLRLGAERAMLLVTYGRRMSAALTAHTLASDAPLDPVVKRYVLDVLANKPVGPPPPGRLAHYASLISAAGPRDPSPPA